MRKSVPAKLLLHKLEYQGYVNSRPISTDYCSVPLIKRFHKTYVCVSSQNYIRSFLQKVLIKLCVTTCILYNINTLPCNLISRP